jgi:hypothetical protein
VAGRLISCWLVLALLVSAQTMRMTVRQLEQFIKSSIELRHDDRKVAAYLKKVILRDQLERGMVEDLQGLGAGPKTVEALEALASASKALPPPAPEAPKAVPAAIPPPSAEEQQKVLDEAREYALNYSKQLPNFICTQVTRRYADPSGLEIWQRQDVLTAKLSYFENKEDYKVILVNNRPVDFQPEQVGGTISRGEFGTLLLEVFEPETEAKLTWSRWATLRGRRMHVYEYRVVKPLFSIRYETESIVAPYSGLVYVDAKDRTVARLRRKADNLPPSFPVQEVFQELDYDQIEIGGGQQFILPLKVMVRSRSGKLLTKNEIEFRMYRKFGAETTIKFDTPEELPADKTTEQPPK